MSEPKILYRIKLYEQVWSKPIIHLAKEYGLSDNGLRKICKKLGVPLPGSGYWAKVQFGKKVERPPLTMEAGYPETYESKPEGYQSNINLSKPNKNIEIDPRLQQIINFEKLPKNRIKVPKQIDQFHPLVRRTLNSLRGQKVDYKGLVESKIDCLDIDVSPRNLNRALRIFHAIISSLSARGIKFTFKSEVRKRHCCFSIWEENIFLAISEKISQRKLTDDEIEEGKGRNKYFWDTHQYTPTGTLTLRVYDGERGGYCKEFVDGKNLRVESKLNDLVVYLYSLSLKLKKERNEREERHKQYAIEERKREERERQIRLENLKKNLLFKQAECWQKTTMVRNFIEAVKENIQTLDMQQRRELDIWINWASSQVNDLDPLYGDFIRNWNWALKTERDRHWI